ncbi:uncharacterized protein EAE98_000421 [Botrytis deweyae]|uniref:Adenosine deaminase domain-containing protein n=1 Tax=Botrytis deweyae TaxID=2478750 RepID=A0ABQ7J2N7_9HELO|nr:uncharacterized protein EAE98_000421 [Botrytis deweyae]KAF7940294.1 hypothetical protein EAE98_000421 [Botrytis deweyae]
MENSTKFSEYESNRAKLVADEQKYRGDYGFVKSLSPTAQAASTIVSRLQQFNRQVLFDPFESMSPLRSDSGFPRIKESMARTALLEIMKKLPKGAILHAHHAACVSIDFIIEKMIETPGMYISASRPLDEWWAKREKRIKIKFTYSSSQPRQTRSSVNNIWDPDYIPNSLVPVSLAASTYCDYPSTANYDKYRIAPGFERQPLRGKSYFITWLRTRLTKTESQPPYVSGSINEACNTFQSGKKLLDTIIHNEPIFRPLLKRIFEGLDEDNVKWIEIRMVFKVEFRLEWSDKPSGEVEMARVIWEEREKFAIAMKKKNKEWWGLRIIWTGLRLWKDEEIKADMEACMRVKERYPDLISGYDLEGQEKLGRTLEDLVPICLWFKQQYESRNLNIPFFLHAGECLGNGDVNDHNLYDAILLGTRRIGHGYSLPRHPLLEKICKERQIMIESCPLSDESLRLTNSANAHTLPMLLAKGVSASLNCDDPFLLGQETIGVSMEFFMCIWSWDNLDLGGLGHLAQNSVRWSQFEDQTDEDWQSGIRSGEKSRKGLKAQRMREWKKDWEEFCAWVVERYGEPWGNEDTFKATLEERAELVEQNTADEDAVEKELDRIAARFKEKEESIREWRKKEIKRRKFITKAKELMAEEKLQKNMSKGLKEPPDSPDKTPKMVLKKLPKS